MSVPTDPVILLSYVNTKLRDCYASLDALCTATETDKQELTDKLASIGYYYDEEHNCFS